MEFKKRQPIGIELVKRGIVTEKDIEQALNYQKSHRDKKIGEILYILEACDGYTLINAIGEIIGIKGIMLTQDDVKIDVFQYISPENLVKNKILPFDIEGGKIKVCFEDTSNAKNIENMRLLMLNKGLVMEKYVTFGGELDKIIKNLTNQDSYEEGSSKLEGQDSSTTVLVDEIIKNAIKKRTSDIHFEPQENEVRVRYRIDGKLITVAKIPKERQLQIIGRLKAISNMHQEKQESQDGRILLYEDYNIRVSSQRNVYGEKFVLRLLKKTGNIRDIFELGYMGSKEELERTINKRNSITIVAAPTGEGKTTTLYSIMDKLNRPDINITTIEDPVEIRISGLNQIEIDARQSFSDSLRTVLRQDPDIILVGEIRDRETAEIATQAAQTGHYVLSTIHTIDAVEVITRLRKIGISDYDIASSVGTTMSQRLVRRLCPHCKKERELTEKEKHAIKSIGEKYNEEFNLDGVKTYDAIGCKQCNNTGYFERIAIFEILEFTEEISELIMNGKSSIEIRRKALEGKYRPFVIDGIKKVIDGTTNLDELNEKILIYNQ